MKKAVFVLLCLIFILSFCACGEAPSAESTTGESTTDILPETTEKNLKNDDGCYRLADEIYIEIIEPYSGIFVEDGSDEKVRNIMSVTVRNDSDVSYELFDFSLTVSSEEYHFSVKSLLAGRSCAVLEKDRKVMPEKTDIDDIFVSDSIAFEEEPSFCLDKLEISYTDYIVNAENITDSPLRDVYVYYKGVSGSEFFGGIIYRISLGDIAPGETVQGHGNKFDTGRMKIIFVTYDE